MVPFRLPPSLRLSVAAFTSASCVVSRLRHPVSCGMRVAGFLAAVCCRFGERLTCPGFDIPFPFLCVCRGSFPIVWQGLVAVKLAAGGVAAGRRAAGAKGGRFRAVGVLWRCLFVDGEREPGRSI